MGSERAKHTPNAHAAGIMTGESWNRARQKRTQHILDKSPSLMIYTYTHIYIYIYTYIHICIYIYMYSHCHKQLCMNSQGAEGLIGDAKLQWPKPKPVAAQASLAFRAGLGFRAQGSGLRA